MIIFLSISILLFIAIISVLIFATGKREQDRVVKKEKKIKAEKKDDGKIFEIEIGESKTLEVKENSNIILKNSDKKVNYKVKQITPYVIVIDNYGEEMILFQDKPKELDFDKDGKIDVSLLLNYWDKNSANLTVSFEENVVANEQESKFIGVISKVDSIYKTSSLQNITLSIKVNAGTYIRYKADDNQIVEKFYSPNSIIQLEIKDKLMIWLSNAGVVSFDLKNISKGYTPGEEGEVAVKLLQWERRGDSEYEFVAKTVN